MVADNGDKDNKAICLDETKVVEDCNESYDDIKIGQQIEKDKVIEIMDSQCEIDAEKVSVNEKISKHKNKLTSIFEKEGMYQ